MSKEARRAFRLDNEVLAFRFTATVSDRASDTPVERLHDPARLGLWLDVNGLGTGSELTSAELSRALELRETIYRIGAATAQRTSPDASDIDTINASAAAGHATIALEGGNAHWRLTETALVADALGVLANDAIQAIGGPHRSHIKTCEGSGCAGLFLDTSRGANRRWCSMNTCGNKVKKSRLAAR
ncbi:ABATE domain-containing protein [Embleya sp. NPDC005971]|uniref:CGNR zinc finger domain-containing protein n=1 Tax=Embleya sp. NPDC005971 TaxID=3156724 RepID=UPI0033F464D7